MKKVSQEVFLKILEVIGARYEGVTKANEPIVSYNGRKITIGRKKRFDGEGYKEEAIKKILEVIAVEKSKKEKKTPKQIYHELKERVKEIVGYDF
jgi:hypothetical protein